MATPIIAGIADDMLDYFREVGITDARRKYLPTAQHEELSTRRVEIVPKTRRKDRGNRTADHKIYELEIYVQQQVEPSDNQTIDNLIYTVDQIWDLFEESGDLRTAALNGTKWTGEIEFDLDQMYDIDSLRDDRLFSSVTIVRYRLDS